MYLYSFTIYPFLQVKDRKGRDLLKQLISSLIFHWKPFGYWLLYLSVSTVVLPSHYIYILLYSIQCSVSLYQAPEHRC